MQYTANRNVLRVGATWTCQFKNPEHFSSPKPQKNPYFWERETFRFPGHITQRVHGCRQLFISNIIFVYECSF